MSFLSYNVGKNHERFHGHMRFGSNKLTSYLLCISFHKPVNCIVNVSVLVKLNSKLIETFLE